MRFLSEEELIASLNQAALEKARSLIKSGADVDSILLFLRARGFSQIDTIFAAKALMGISHTEAKKLVCFSKTWSDRFDSVKDLHEKAEKALLELAAFGEIELVEHDDEVS